MSLEVKPVSCFLLLSSQFARKLKACTCYPPPPPPQRHLASPSHTYALTPTYTISYSFAHTRKISRASCSCSLPLAGLPHGLLWGTPQVHSKWQCRLEDFQNGYTSSAELEMFSGGDFAEYMERLKFFFLVNDIGLVSSEATRAQTATTAKKKIAHLTSWLNLSKAVSNRNWNFLALILTCFFFSSTFSFVYILFFSSLTSLHNFFLWWKSCGERWVWSKA